MINNIIITAVSQDYLNSCLTLIASIHRTSCDIVNKIIVYSINLNKNSITFLNTLKYVTVVDLQKYKDNYFDGWLTPKQHAYKGFCLVNAANYGNNILWIDSGALLLKNCAEIFQKIDNNHIFCVEDLDNNLNLTWTHKKARRILKATPFELCKKQLCSGIFGYKKGGKYQHLIDESDKFFSKKDCVHGSHFNHRHDQSILSILTTRYNCPRDLMEIYAEWRDFEKSKNNGKVIIFVHRRNIHDITGLLVK